MAQVPPFEPLLAGFRRPASRALPKSPSPLPVLFGLYLLNDVLNSIPGRRVADNDDTNGTVFERHRVSELEFRFIEAACYHMKKR